MALDNAEFISELSIADPPGTDPLNQGDDHIRTIKKAVQQSFPNVGSAVPQTGAQMAQMAIKNEGNIFTQVNTFNTTTEFNGHLRAADGAVGSPVYSFLNNTNMGMYRKSSNVLAFAVGATEIFNLTTARQRIFAAGGLQNTDGSAAAPTFTFTNQSNMGMYRHGSDTLGLAVAGAVKQLIRAASTDFVQASSTGGVSINFVNSAGVVAYSIQYEGTAGFQPGQLSVSRFNRTTGAFIDIPLYINATTGRVHTALPVLSP